MIKTTGVKISIVFIDPIGEHLADPGVTSMSMGELLAFLWSIRTDLPIAEGIHVVETFVEKVG